MKGYSVIPDSDIMRGGTAVELLDPSYTVVAEVFRDDSDDSISVTTFENKIPFDVMRWCLEQAEEHVATDLRAGSMLI